MGLDIYLIEFRKTTPRRKEDRDDYIRLIDDDGNYDNRGFPEWTEQYKRNKTEVWFDWDKYKEQTGFDIYNMQWCCTQYDEEKESWVSEFLPKDFEESDTYDHDSYVKREKSKIRVILKNVPEKKVRIKVIYYKRIGYQRKGLNGRFYKDHENDCGEWFAWTKDSLQYVMDNYCDDDEKTVFKTNVIDKFTEGESCVWFNW